jgi:hypothetical protein
VVEFGLQYRQKYNYVEPRILNVSSSRRCCSTYKRISEQTSVNKRSGRKCSNYEKLEKEYQEVQEHWEEYGDKPSWDRMFILINLAVFNAVNKKLEHLLEKEEIEGRALDITMNILRALLNKKERGEEWKLGKLSSAVHLPCKALYKKELQFNDKLLGEDAFTGEDSETGVQTIMEFADSYLEQGTGIYHLHGGIDR